MLQVNEICHTIMGESRDAGLPCVLVRLAGCHRRCRYCDTAFAFEDGRGLTVEQICTEVAPYGSRTVLVTGGEPLQQQESLLLMDRLLAAGKRVVLETSGTKGGVPLSAVPADVRRVVDVKTPGSGIAADQIDWDAIAALTGKDELKFVCCDREDYEWARDLVRAPDGLPELPERIFSAAAGCLEPVRLAEWILADRLQVRLQLQLHKVLWPGRERGV